MRQTTLHATRVSNPCILFWINAFLFLLLSYVTHIYKHFSTFTFVRYYQDTVVSFALLLFPQYRLRITNRSFKSDNKTDETLSCLVRSSSNLFFSFLRYRFFNRISLIEFCRLHLNCCALFS